MFTVTLRRALAFVNPHGAHGAPHMQILGFQLMLRQRLAFGLIGLVVIEALWVGLIYPLLPTTPTGWLAVLVSGILVAAWACVSVYAILWLQQRRSMKVLCNALGAVVALSLGIGIFVLVAHQQEFVHGNFSYFAR